jgi:hypothetical protein
MNDTEMLDWLAARCFRFDDEFEEDEIVVIVPCEFSPLGTFTLSSDGNRRALREAIQKARLKELHKEVE